VPDWLTGRIASTGHSVAYRWPPGQTVHRRAAGAAVAQASEEPDAFPGTPAAALKMMMRGNERWVRGKARHPHQSARWREHVAPHQEPFATVFSCIGSRVPPELVFDRGLGDFFVVRTGAQALAVTTAWTQERSISSPELETRPAPRRPWARRSSGSAGSPW